MTENLPGIPVYHGNDHRMGLATYYGFVIKVAGIAADTAAETFLILSPHSEVAAFCVIW